MLTVLLLTSLEKFVNFVLKSDAITQAGLAPLTGKVLRLTMQTPALSVDILFNDDHLRLEPVTLLNDALAPSPINSTTSAASRKSATSEASKSAKEDSDFAGQANSEDARQQRWQHQAGIGHTLPDCTIRVANLAELLNLLRAPQGNLPIEGDYKILLQVKQLMAGFDPDIAGQLEPLIGVALASQLGLLIRHLKNNVATTAKDTFNDVADWVDEVSGNAAPDPEMEAEATNLKQQLLKLRADIEREEARLALIKAEQAAFKPKPS